MVGDYKVVQDFQKLNCKELEDYFDESLNIIMNRDINNYMKIDFLQKLLKEYGIVERH